MDRFEESIKRLLQKEKITQEKYDELAAVGDGTTATASDYQQALTEMGVDVNEER